jgi:hypothetical protein
MAPLDIIRDLKMEKSLKRVEINQPEKEREPSTYNCNVELTS